MKLIKLDYAMIVLVIICMVFIVNKTTIIESTYYNNANNLSIALAGELQLAINEQFSIMDAVESFTRLNHNTKDFGQRFQSFSNPLILSKDFIKNISVAPNGIQQYVIPLEGNEMVIGHNLLTDERTQVREDVQRSIATQSTVISGPYILRQGDLGLIARKALYMDGEFWGLIVMVTNFEKLLEDTGYSSLNTDFHVSLSNTSDENIHGIDDGKTLVSQQINLPEGYLTLKINSSNTSQSRLNRQKLQWWLVLVIMIFLLIFISIQEKKRLLELKQKLKERTQEINVINKNLDKSKHLAVTALVRGLSHEVNTPLGSCLTYATYLSSQLKKLESSSNFSQKTSTLANIHSSSDAIVEGLEQSIDIMNQLQNISSVKQVTEQKHFNLFDLLSNCKLSTPIVVSTLPVTLSIECPNDLMIYADADALSQLLTLLIDNSITHGFNTCETGNIDLTAYDDKDCTTLIYKDNGIGISPDHIDTLFDPFYTVDMSQYSGLGLYTVYIIATQKMKGNIQVSSIPDKGITFTIQLPKL